jgi:hypothetical protein
MSFPPGAADRPGSSRSRPRVRQTHGTLSPPPTTIPPPVPMTTHNESEVAVNPAYGFDRLGILKCHGSPALERIAHSISVLVIFVFGITMNLVSFSAADSNSIAGPTNVPDPIAEWVQNSLIRGPNALVPPPRSESLPGQRGRER